MTADSVEKSCSKWHQQAVSRCSGGGTDAEQRSNGRQTEESTIETERSWHALSIVPSHGSGMSTRVVDAEVRASIYRVNVDESCSTGELEYMLFRVL